jgi:hypothetical protein
VRSQICPSMFNIKITFIQERALVLLHHAYASSFLPSGCPLRQRSCKHFPPKTKISAVLICLQKTQESASICCLQFKFNAVLLRQLVESSICQYSNHSRKIFFVVGSCNFKVFPSSVAPRMEGALRFPNQC